MDYYIDVTIQPDAQLRENILLNKVYSKLHRVLHDLKTDAIGVSFPEYKILLGHTVRIHSNKARLENLQQVNWLGSSSGYCQLSEFRQIPENVKYRIVSRKQSTMTLAKLRRLKVRGAITTIEQEKEYKAKMFSFSLNNPYLEMESRSNGHKHRRFIQFSEFFDTPTSGEFDTFGLSKHATIPWF